MQIKLLKKIALYISGLVVISGLALGIHLYFVMKPKKVVNESTLALARIDFQQSITPADANKINQWLSQQQGVTHVLCNETAGIAVFSFYPMKANADQLVSQLQSVLHYKAQRFVPDEKSLKSGCPAGF